MNLLIASRFRDGEGDCSGLSERMVKTRHNPGGDDERVPVFYSLHSRGSRRNHVDHQDEYESDSDELMIPRKKSHFADRSLDDKIGLRLRPRVRQRRNYFDEYFSDYEIEDEKSPVSRKKNSSKKMDGCGPVGRRQGKKKSAPMRKPRQVDKHASEDELEAEYSGEEGTYLRNTRQRSQASSIQESSLNSKTTKTFDQTMAGSKRKLVEPPPDMYTIVKRKRHSSYSASVLYQECESSNSSRNSNDQENGDTDEDDKDEEDEDNVDEMEDEEDEDEDDETNNNNRSCKKSGKSPIRSSYYLRQNKPRTQHWAPPIEPTRRRPARNSFRIGSNDEYLSPSRKKDSRKKAAFCRTNSSGSEDDTDSDQYNLQKDSSLSWSRFQPLNLTAKDLENQHNRKDRVRAGASHADLDPMRIDLSISFEDVGGQEKTVLELKEKLFLPILYPEFNTRLKLNVPRGVLFHGPPGTGKTLMARALAAECSRGRQQFAFFMRKGADIMSKWVGESERSLRMLFDKAYQMRPSIVFFDEIDGLAPVRSSRQDQIHSSIVSTLLALMDGLDSRGEVIVIGATNRIDALDPALRRPGRFDQEFYFGLPDQEARQKILAIHTKEWKPKLKESFLRELAKETAGYCGADLKMLCTEAWLTAMRNRYPQILESQDKLQIDVNNIVVTARDFADAREKVVPSSQRTISPPSYPLCPTMAPLLHRPFQSALKCIQEIFPHAIDGLHKTASLEEDASENEETMPSIFEHPRKKNDQPEARFFAYQEHSYIKPSTYRPRLLLAGATGQGLSSHLAPALLHHLEDFPINVLDLPTIMGDGSRTAEEACIHLLREVNRRLPGILYMPDVDLWWELVQETVRGTVTVLVSRIKPTNPLLLLASSSRPYDELPHSLQSLFCEAEAFTIETPNADERLEFFRDLLVKQPTKVVTTRRRHPKCMERLPKAAPEPRPHLTELERDFLNKREEKVLTELRCYLREILNQLSKDRRFCHFTKPVDSETTPDYYNIIRNPMDMDTMMTKIDQHRYLCLEDFMTDITLIRENALEYNPDCTNLGARIRHSAHALVDTAVAMVNDTVDEEFVKMLRAVKESRERRGETPKVPDFAYTARHPSQPTPSAVTASTPLSAGVRCSRRVRGLEVEAMPTLEVVERCGQLERSLQRQHKEPTLSNHGDKNTSNSSVMSQESESAKQDGTSRRLSPHRRRGDPPPPHKRWMRTSSEPSSLPDREESEEETADCAEPRRLRGDVRTLITNTSPAQKTSLNSRKAAATATTSSSPSADASALLSTSNSFSGTLRGASSSTPKLGNFASQATSQPQGQHDLGTLSHDSGVSSSTDSNGDSMDSVDQTLLQKDSNCHQEQDTNENQGGSEEPAPRLPVVVNLARLDKLLRKVVDRSAGWTIEELGKLHNAFGRSLFHHRRNHDKTELVEELEAKAEHLCFSKKDHGQ